MKKIKQSYPRRGEMLEMPFEALSDPEFRQLVGTGLAIPGQQGSSLFVAKWRDGPTVEVETFLKALHAQGSRLEVRRYKTDVNVRVIRGGPLKRGSHAVSPPKRNPSK